MIDSGIKTEEYREISHHWLSRLFLPGDYYYLWLPLRKFAIGTREIERLKREVYCTSEMRFRNFDAVRFHRGYSNVTMTFFLEKMTIGKGHPEWGAPTDKEVFIIKLGNRV